MLLVAGFAVWSALVFYGGTDWFDLPISGHFAGLNSEGALGLMQAVTEMGDVFYMLAFAIVLIIIKRTRRVGIALLILLVLTTIAAGYIKCGVDRDRPEPDVAGGPLPIEISSDTFSLFCQAGYGASYPSGHAARAAAIGTILGIALASRFPSGAYLMLAYPLMMSLSRVYVLQHYPADVIGGTVLGVLLAGIVAKKTGIGLEAKRVKGLGAD